MGEEGKGQRAEGKGRRAKGGRERCPELSPRYRGRLSSGARSDNVRSR